MNETIAQLAEQAGQESFDSDNDLNLVVSTDNESYEVPSTFIEKFAELIVRECAKVVFEKTGPKSALNLLEHFGVEE